MNRELSTDEKVDLLMSQAADDRDGTGRPESWNGILRPINIRTLRPAGRGGTKIFRILLTNACSFSCAYCPMRAERALARHAIAPESLARIFIDAHRRGWAAGLFLTSGIPKSPEWAMDRMIALIEILRFQYRFAGYIHAKAVAGAKAEQIDRLTLLCDRVSYNLESACQTTLDRVAPEKNAGDGIELLRRVRDLSASRERSRVSGDPRPPGPAAAAGSTTQFVVGLDSQADREILDTAFALWKEGTIHHPHFAAFRPIAGTPLERERETPLLRENRLYQADYLLRRYGFAPDELFFNGSGNLPFSHDPKMTWALTHPERFPVEITTAGRSELLRVPGLGPRSVEVILRARRSAVSFSARDLARVGAGASRAAGFLQFRGRRLRPWKVQPPLFEPEANPPPSRIYSVSPGTFR